MIASAKDVTVNPGDLDAQHRWHSAQQGVRISNTPHKCVIRENFTSCMLGCL